MAAISEIAANRMTRGDQEHGPNSEKAEKKITPKVG
jgi:hypothetical protein